MHFSVQFPVFFSLIYYIVTKITIPFYAILKNAGSGFDKVVKTTIFLSDMDNFGIVNGIYAEFFGEHKPARSTVAVKSLPKEALVEIECIALSN